MERPYIEILLTEGRKEDAFERYISKAEEGPIKNRLIDSYILFVEGDPSGNHKYLAWMMGKMLDMMIERGVNYPDYHQNGVLNLVQEFHRNVQRLRKKDINQYKTVKELDNAIQALPKTKREEKLEGADRIYEDDNLLVVTPKTVKGSCYYGAGSKWCVAARDNNYFEDYHSEGYLYFIIWKLDMPQTMKEYQKIARYIPHGHPYETEGEYYTARDRSISEYRLEYDLFGRTEEYNKNLGYVMATVPERQKPYWSSWENAKIKIDTHYAKNGINKPRQRDINPMGDGDFGGDDDLMDFDF
jgi:hypothetical protein